MTIEADFSGQLDFFDPATFGHEIHLIGLGGIGSAIAPLLARLGVRTRLHLWDDDDVEEHNLPCQAYFRRHLGRSKAVSMAEIVAENCEPQLEVVVHQERVTADTVLSGIVISGVDSMSARNDIWKAVRYNTRVPLYMDGRMGGMTIQLMCLNPSLPREVSDYEETLYFTDDEADELPCAARTVTGPPNVLAGWVLIQLVRFASKRPLASILYQDFDTP